jgi:N-acetylglutamate synthase-like GNAT family acetyltransferase
VGRRGRGDADAGAAVERSKTSSSSPDSSSPEVEPASEARSSPTARARETSSGGETESGKLKSKPREKLGESMTEPVDVEPTLVLRAAKPADAEGLAKLISQLGGIAVSKDDVTRNLAALRKAGAGIHLAALGDLVGCVAWAVVPTLQRGPVGRLTVLVVDQDHRRRGIGTRLLAEAEAALAKQGCTLVEAMSDIEIKNSHNFFRSVKFDQTSYRFARKLAQ